jgi:hypothetical protein
MPIAFDPLSHELAELSITDSGGELRLRSSGFPTVHELGVEGRPRWRLRTAPSTDDAWQIDVEPTGALLSRQRSAPEDLEWRYMSWAEGSLAEADAALLGALPDGRYLLVRSGVAPRRAASVLLGNEWVPSPPNARALLDAQPHYAAVFGARSDAPPDLAQPLFAVAVLNYVGDSVMDALLFFPCAEPRAGAAATGDSVLVVPLQGQLVVDAVQRFSEADSARSRARWRDGGARRFAEALAAAR